MRKVLGLFALVALLAAPSFAQTPKIELSAGPTFTRYTAPSGYYLDMGGWTGSAEYNLRRWIGAEVDASGDYSNKTSLGFTSVHKLLAGAELFPFRHHVLTPWGHALFGEGYYRNTIPASGGFPSKLNTDLAFTWMAGVGVDLNVKKRWGVRLLEFDYDPTRFYNNKPSQPSYRVSVGIICRIGERKK